jgi:hypothetical protein
LTHEFRFSHSHLYLSQVFSFTHVFITSAVILILLSVLDGYQLFGCVYRFQKNKKLHTIVAPLMKFILSGKRVVKSMILISVLSFTPFQITGHSRNLEELNHLKFDQSY